MTTTTNFDAVPTTGLLHMLKRTLASTVSVAMVLSGMPRVSMAALTDLSPIPIASGTTVQGKPNIMLLMDTSGSMAWSHMPDEVEKVGTTDYTGSVGYRASECNSLYYNPQVEYTLPKLPGGTSFPQPSFTNAPYAGFVSYFAAPDARDLSAVDLSAAFQAFDAKTLRAGISVPADPPQPAYYYVYSGGPMLNYNSTACRQVDVGTSAAATGGGNWTRVLVGPASGPAVRPDERDNFATWYSFYRTRLSLIKTAASLAFNPLTNSFRVGLITVEPKTLPTDPAINQDKYVPIADFNLPQRTEWYRKLFAQPAEGASPAREGLARVGRHYAGKQDGINSGMTGDPMQFSCQQNFTIMTTDGYWNSQTETPGAGPVQIDGVTKVGQQDNVLTPPSGLSPRPIWEGSATDTAVTTDNVNTFSYVPCGSYVMEETKQRSASSSQLTYATSQRVTRTVQTTQSTAQVSQTRARVDQSTSQHLLSTAQTLRTDTQVRQTTAQITASTAQLTQESAQLQMRKVRIDQSTTQLQGMTQQTRQTTSRTDQNTLQTRVQTSRTDQSTSQTTQTTTQTTASTLQLNMSTTQASRSTSQQLQSTLQWTQRTSQDRVCDSRDEGCVAVGTGSCAAGGFFYCETVTTGPTLVASCLPNSAQPGNNFTTTTCTSATTGPTPVMSCTVSPAIFGNNFVATNCNTVLTGPTPVLLCTPQGPNGFNGYTTTTCGTVSTPLTPVASCTPQPANAGNSYTATNCTPVTTGPLGVAACANDPAALGNSYTQTICGVNNTGPVGVTACTSSGGNVGNGWTTTNCNPVTTGPTAVSSCTPATGNVGNSWVTTTCAPVVSGPTPVATCAASGGTLANSWTTTTCPNVVGTPLAVATCTPLSGNAGNGYTATTCATVSTGPVGVLSCTDSPATSGNSWTTTTCAANDTPWTGVSSCGAQPPNGGNGWETTSCQTVTTGPTAVASCIAATAKATNFYTATICTPVYIPNWTNVGSCVPDAASAGNGFVSTECQILVGAPVGVGSCTPSGPNGLGQSVICSPSTTPTTGVPSCTAQTGNAGNGWVDIICGTNNTGPTLVATCTAAAASAGNAWTTTTCATSPVGPTPVANCVADTADVFNGYTETTCSSSSTGPIVVQTCTPDAATAGNSYTTTSCADLIIGPIPVPACAASGATIGNSWTDTTCTPVNTGPTLVASCIPESPSIGNNWTTVTCPSVLTGPDPVSSCTDQTPNLGNSFVSVTCHTTTSPDAGVSSCTPITATAVNNWTETQCATLTGGGGTGSCTAQPASAGNNWVETTCAPINAGPTLVTSCTPQTANAGNNWLEMTCSEVTTGPTLVPMCSVSMYEAPSAVNNFVETTCSMVRGSKIVYTTTHTETTQQMNAGNPMGPPLLTSMYTTAPTDLDGVCSAPNAPPPLPMPNPQKAGLAAGPYPPAGCAAWPCTTSTANNDGSINSLADVAQYYYKTDLRPLMLDNVRPVATGPEDDRATWQHMTTFTVGLGVSGTLNYRSDYKTATTGDFADIRVGTRNWPLWPDPGLNYDGFAGGNFGLWNNPKSIDDFWHTAVNGRGTYFNAKKPEALVTGLAAALSTLAVETGSGSGITVSNREPSATDNFAFTTLYTTQRWTGDVQGFNIDVTTGSLSATANWSAQTKLAAKTGAACDNRNIYLFRAGATDNKVNFSWNSFACDGSGSPSGPADNGLNAAEKLFFGNSNVSNLGQYLSMTDGTLATVDQRSAAEGANLVNFLRGQRGLEGFVSNDLGKLYRSRSAVLGDVVNGQAAYVRAPFASYGDSGYAAFKSANATRTPMLYVPANDGMLHAFYAGADATDVQGGVEAWAFMPTTVLPNLYKLADTNYANHHEFFVDGTPVAADAYDGSAWKTIVVAGLNAGGKGYYALDVTNPTGPKALWEFKQSATCYDGSPATAGADCHIGYTYGKPVVTKLANGTWVVLVTSGYNNVNSTPVAGDGEGYLYVLDAFTGKILHRISTGVGDSTTPSGLAQINVFIDYAVFNNTARQAYGTDMLGNVWRFDINDTIAPGGREAALLGTAKDPGGAPQPITTRPELAQLAGKPMLFVGTGRLLGATDFGDLQVQSVYGIVDTMGPGTVYPGALRTTFKPLELSAPGATRTVICTGSNAQCGSTDGWVVDLAVSGVATGERVNVEMKLGRGTLVFASNTPSNAPCDTGGKSWLNMLSFSTGLPVTTSGGVASVSLFNSLATGLNVIGIKGELVALRRFSNAENKEDRVPFDTPGTTGKRISWREIAQ